MTRFAGRTRAQAGSGPLAPCGQTFIGPPGVLRCFEEGAADTASRSDFSVYGSGS